MCRGIQEGGRRCPHDSSAARQARRIAQKFSTYTEKVNPASEAHSATYHMFNNSHEGRNVIMEALNDVKQKLDAKIYPVIFNNVECNDYHELTIQAGFYLEQKITLLGATVVAEVEKQTGVTFKSIVEEYNERHATLTGRTETLMKQHEELVDEVHAVFGGYKSSLIFDTVRRKHHDDPSDVVAAGLKEKIDAIDRETSENRTALSELNNGYTPGIKQKYLHNITVMMDVLQSVRPFGGALSVDKTSDARKSDALQKAVQFYPKEWVEQSNSNPVSLVVKKTLGRAHYTHWSKTAKVSDFYRIYEYSVREEPEDMDSVIKIVPDSDGMVKYSNDSLGVNIDRHVGNSTVLYLQPEWEYPNVWNTRFNADGSPKGRGWRTYVHPSTGDVAYRRILKQRATTVNQSSANILVDENKNHVNGEVGFDSAIHELAHRMEAVEVPFLKNVQKAFYDRRTNNPDGSKQKPVRLYKGRKEFSIPDSFSSDYMGKQYSGDVHFEILSTGMEAIFGGDYAGGLVGLKNKKADEDMRNFIVGTLASL